MCPEVFTALFTALKEEFPLVECDKQHDIGVVRAYWQGCTVHVEMADGWHFVYDDFSGYSSRWKP